MAQNSCPNCGDSVLKARWDAGYKYCKKQECFERLGRKKGITMFDRPPDHDDVDVSTYDLDDIDAYSDDD